MKWSWTCFDFNCISSKVPISSPNSSEETSWHQGSVHCLKIRRKGKSHHASGLQSLRIPDSNTSLIYQLAYAVPVILALSAYLSSINGDFVHDDISAIVKNADVVGDNPLWHLFANDFWGCPLVDPRSHKSYRPLTVMSFRIDWWVGAGSPLYFHTTNVIIHAFVTFLFVHLLLSSLKLSSMDALLTGVLFALHPIHTEAVSGIVGRADLLAGLSFLASFLAYDKSIKCGDFHKSQQWVTLCGIWSVIGVLCKENAISVLPFCVAWELICFGGAFKRLFNNKSEYYINTSKRLLRVSLLMLTIIFLRLIVMKGQPLFAEQDNPASYSKKKLTRFYTFAFLPVQNFWLLLCPSQLSYDWQFGSIQLITSHIDVRNFFSLLFYAILTYGIITALSIKEQQTKRIISWAVLAMVVPFIPASNLFFRVGFVVAERILYIPSFGFCIFVGVGASGILRLLPRRETFKNVLIFFFLLFFLKTSKRNLDWKSREKLYISGVKTLSHNAKMHYNLANWLAENNFFASSIHHYNVALTLWPSYSSAHNNLGTVLVQEGRAKEAEHHFILCLKHHPEHAHAIRNLATLWRKEGRNQDAVRLLETSWDRNKKITSSDIPLILADVYEDIGEKKKAEDIFLKLITECPTDADIHVQYAIFLQNSGHLDRSSRHFEAALSLLPSHHGALTGYALLLDIPGDYSKALSLYTRDLEAQWNVEAAAGVGRVYLQQGKIQEASSVLLDVLDTSPQYYPAKVYLAQVRLQQKDYSGCAELLQDVLVVVPNDRQALYQLSLLHEASNRSEEAIKVARQAVDGCFKPRDLCAALHSHLADLLHNSRRIEAAMTSYQTAVVFAPELVKAHLNLGAIYHTQGNFTRAWKHYNEALRIEPDNSILLDNIAKLERAQGLEDNSS